MRAGGHRLCNDDGGTSVRSEFSEDPVRTAATSSSVPHQFEAYRWERYIFGRRRRRRSDLGTEVGIAGSDDPAQLRSIVVVVQEGNDLLRGIRRHRDPGWPAAVGGQYRCSSTRSAVQRYPRGGNAPVSAQSGGCSPTTLEIDQAAPRDPQSSLIYVCRARRSALPRRAP